MRQSAGEGRREKGEGVAHYGLNTSDPRKKKSTFMRHSVEQRSSVSLKMALSSRGDVFVLASRCTDKSEVCGSPST